LESYWGGIDEKQQDIHRPMESCKLGKQHRRVDQIQEDQVGLHVHRSVEGERDIGVREIGGKGLYEGSVRMDYWALIGAGCTRTAGRSTRVGARKALAGSVTTATVFPSMSKNSTL
jgi:hypothetical protein